MTRDLKGNIMPVFWRRIYGKANDATKKTSRELILLHPSISTAHGKPLMPSIIN
jgi:hypothetical protein